LNCALYVGSACGLITSRRGFQLTALLVSSDRQAVASGNLKKKKKCPECIRPSSRETLIRASSSKTKRNGFEPWANFVSNFEGRTNENILFFPFTTDFVFVEPATPRASGLTTESPLTSAAFKPENRVQISDLVNSINSRLDGKYFLCRVLAPFFEMSSIMSIVEDPEGLNAVRIALYNHSKIGTGIEPGSKGIDVGQILVVKNPLFKRTMDGDMCLRSDEPKDVILIPQAQFPILFPGNFFN